MRWPVMLGVLVATALVAGMFMGVVGPRLGLSAGARSTGVGVIVGVVTGVLLVRRRR